MEINNYYILLLYYAWFRVVYDTWNNKVYFIKIRIIEAIRMKEYDNILTLQYMGSKARIISRICDPIINNKSIKTVIDLFAGSGSVGYALKYENAQCK